MGALHIIDRSELPIPDDVKPGKGWSTTMLDMAAYIGAYDVMRLCDSYGGQQVYFPVKIANAPFVDLLGKLKAERLCQAYQRERVTIPTARYALAVARRGGVIAAVRLGLMTVAEAAAKLHLRRDTVAALLRKPTEGQDSVPIALSKPHDPRQMDLFGEVYNGGR